MYSETMRANGLGSITAMVAVVSLLTCAPAVSAGSESVPGEKNLALHPSVVVAVHGDFLTVRATDVPLRVVLRRIALLADVTLLLEGAFERRVSIDVERVPLDEGLRRLLRDENFVLIYALAPSGSRLAGISIHALGSVRTARTFAPEPRADGEPVGGPSEPESSPPAMVPSPPRADGASLATQTDDLVQRALGAGDRAVRREAVEVLGEDLGPRVVGTLVAALHDGDGLVRRTALAALRERAAEGIHDFPLDAIKVLAKSDPEPAVRISALDVLATCAVDERDRDGARKALEEARRDPDQRVRQHSAAFLQGLDTPPTGSEQTSASSRP